MARIAAPTAEFTRVTKPTASTADSVGGLSPSGRFQQTFAAAVQAARAIHDGAQRATGARQLADGNALPQAAKSNASATRNARAASAQNPDSRAAMEPHKREGVTARNTGAARSRSPDESTQRDAAKPAGRAAERQATQAEAPRRSVARDAVAEVPQSATHEPQVGRRGSMPAANTDTVDDVAPGEPKLGPDGAQQAPDLSGLANAPAMPPDGLPLDQSEVVGLDSQSDDMSLDFGLSAPSARTGAEQRNDTAGTDGPAEAQPQTDATNAASAAAAPCTQSDPALQSLLLLPAGDPTAQAAGSALRVDPAQSLHSAQRLESAPRVDQAQTAQTSALYAGLREAAELAPAATADANRLDLLSGKAGVLPAVQQSAVSRLPVTGAEAALGQLRDPASAAAMRDQIDAVGASAPATEHKLAAVGRPSAMTQLFAQLDPDSGPAEITQRVVWMNQQGVQFARIHLHPSDLGPIDISLDQRDGGLLVAMTAQHPLTRDLLESHAARMREQLAADGTRVDRFDVGGGQPGNAEQRGERQDRAARRGGERGPDLADSPPVRLQITGSGLFEAYA